jgi:phthiocerol/phenolphthiocerol synthesis type-I polyketide synthase E
MMGNAATDIAIIGMAGRFPGAASLDQFWENLIAGVESISLFSDGETIVPVGLRGRADYVPARAVLEGIDLFDAWFFGYSPAEASLIDPQQRLFLECAWEAIESSGYDPEAYQGAIGVYAGASTNTYLLSQFSAEELPVVLSDFQAVLGNDKDFLATRVSYKLNLRGPSINVQTACSTSLVAVHLACQGLHLGECDMALAGGVSIRTPQRLGYLYNTGGMYSSDGHCRAFDSRANGTTPGNGVGVVLLKRRSEAETDGDLILATIKGSAINNDGSGKVGFTAPSVSGQASAVAEAMAIADVSPPDIDYIEAHGTGTPLGDPVEVAALAQVFRNSNGNRKCVIGSVKANIGHLDAAAGIAGLIKTVLCLQHRLIPPTLHFRTLNPQIDFQGTPFVINNTPFECTSGTRLLAGVSSFGVGGTNAHVVVAEAPIEPTVAMVGSQLILLSARSPAQLRALMANFEAHLRKHPELNLADVAYTTQVGRRAFGHRAVLLARTLDDAIAGFENGGSQRVLTAVAAPARHRVAFLLTDLENLGRPISQCLYDAELAFKEAVDECAARMFNLSGKQLRDHLFQGGSLLNLEAGFARCASFTVSLALARMWIACGVRPHLILADRTGDAIAACLFGALSISDALSALSSERGIVSLRRDWDSQAGLLQVPVYSVVPGEILTGSAGNREESQLGHTSGGIAEGVASVDSSNTVYIGMGGEAQTSRYLGRQIDATAPLVVSSLAEDHALDALEHIWLCRGRLWLVGVPVVWSQCHKANRRRVSLPTYPFDRQVCWVGPPESSLSVPDHSMSKGNGVRQARPSLRTPYQASQTTIQSRLVNLWEELLGIQGVGIHDNFFDLGGHSVVVIQLISRLEETFGVNVDPEAIFETSDIAQLAVIVERSIFEQVESLTEEEAQALVKDEDRQ